MIGTVQTENDPLVDGSPLDTATELLRDSLEIIRGFSGAKRMSPEEQRRFFHNSRNFFE
jgi:hypothetical protein